MYMNNIYTYSMDQDASLSIIFIGEVVVNVAFFGILDVRDLW